MREINVSQVSDSETARTDPECAESRAEHLAMLGVRSVLELCVGPSLRTAEQAYSRQGITVTGNDIDARWQRYYPDGLWLIGDALQVGWSLFDAVVFAPPLSVDCTGKREDALSVNEVFPRYRDFLSRPFAGVRVMVLPARAIATSADRREMHDLLSSVYDDSHDVTVIPLTSGRRRIRKYVDVYIYNAATPLQAAPIGDCNRP